MNAGGNTPVSETDEQTASMRLLETCWLIARALTIDEIWDTARSGLEQMTGTRAICFLLDAHARLAPRQTGEPTQSDQLLEEIQAGWNEHAPPEIIVSDDSRIAAIACAGKTGLSGAITLESGPGTTISPRACLALAAVATSVGQALDAVGLNGHTISRQQHDLQLDELRRSLGRALHDGPSQDMATALLALEHLMRTKTAITDAPASVALAISTLESAIVSLRTFMGALRGEEPAEVIASLPIGAGEFPGESREQAALSIVQEALRNISKHAGAQTVRITLHRERQGIDVTIEDDGTGFVPSAFPGHFGLEQMRERAALSSGDLTITSAPGSGAEVHFSTPAKSSWHPPTAQQSPASKRRRDSDAQ